MTTSGRKPDEKVLRSVALHSPERSSGIELKPIRDFVSSLFPTVQVIILSSPHKLLGRPQWPALAERVARTRVKDPTKASQSFEPMYGEIDYELRALDGKVRLGGVVYDGRKLANVYMDLLKDAQTLERCSVIFTDRLVTTFSEDDLRHHLRTVVCGFPSIVSMPGVVDAPARPREYHLLRQQLESLGASELQLEELKSRFKDRFLDYDDKRIPEVLKGLCLQAVMFHLTLRPFCDKIGCKLFNAHWQEDLIKSQTSSEGFCSAHSREIEELGLLPRISW